MALVKATLKASLKSGMIQIFSNPQTQGNIQAVAEELSELIANEVDAFVKTGNAVGTDSRGDAHNLTIE